MLDLIEKLDYEPFNNTVMPYDCADRLVAHRIVNKFHVDNPAVSKRLEQIAYLNYIDFDLKIPDVIVEPFSPLSRARSLLHTWFKDFKVDMSDVKYSVSPGESYISSKGEVSLTAKLLDMNHWTTTANCLDDTCVFIYNNISFKRAAKRHIGAVTRREKRNLFYRFRNSTDVGFRIFKQLLIDRVLIITDGARASSVPKSNDKRRFINVEPMFPVILQRALANHLLDVLASQGNNLDNVTVLRKDMFGLKEIELSAQSIHGRMIMNDRYSTIDFSNASDSVSVSAVVSLFPNNVADSLLKYRSHYVKIDGELHAPHKLSSMGNGFTFETMTCLLYAIAKTFTSDCRVYGDDVIIPNKFALDFVSACSGIGFNINNDKTFINSFFRESCGYFYSSYHDSYITSFDFGQIISLSDIIITCNKLSVILKARQISLPLFLSLEKTRDQLAALVHASRKGPFPSSPNMQRKFLAMYIFDEGYKKKQSRAIPLRELRAHYIEKNLQYFSAIQVSKLEVSLIYIPFFVPKRSSHVFTDMRSLDILLPALYSGKRLIAVTKGKGRWIDLPAFVSSDGTVTLISNLVKQSKEIWTDRLDGVVNTVGLESKVWT